ncbi:MAG TPA: efflux RND transporter periplasmic adaptor subunit [Pirellulales bacterium]|nr:efflux RND transporter periplasmic adaptor subunit [Pirellulales bacterium]
MMNKEDVATAEKRGDCCGRWCWTVLGAAVLVAGCSKGPTHGGSSASGPGGNRGVVSGPVTYVASRVDDAVVAVLVENDQRVEQGAMLVRLDPQKLQTACDQKKAELEVAEAQVEQTRSDVRAQAAAAVADWFTIVKERNQLRQNVAQLRSDVAALKLRQAEMSLAENQYQRAVQLAKQRVITADEMEQRQAGLQVAQQQVNQAEAQVQQARASVGLEPVGDGATVPPDLEQKFATIQKSLFTWAQGLAQIGFPIKLDQLNPDVDYGQEPGAKAGPEFQHKIDEWIETSPAMRLAQAKLNQARAELRHSELELGYAEIRAPVAGFVDGRVVHPGQHVEAGQTLLTIRPLDKVWIDAQFPQTDLERLRIGLPATIRVIGYPDRTFAGRVAGLGPVAAKATSTPGEHAEDVPALPVRIDLAEAKATDKPLLIGLAVDVEIDWNAAPERSSGSGRSSTAVGEASQK